MEREKREEVEQCLDVPSWWRIRPHQITVAVAAIVVDTMIRSIWRHTLAGWLVGFGGTFCLPFDL